MNTIGDLLEGISNISTLEVFNVLDVDKTPMQTQNSILLKADGSVIMSTSVIENGNIAHFVDRQFSGVEEFLKMAKCSENKKQKDNITIEELFYGIECLSKIEYWTFQNVKLGFKDEIVLNGDGSGDIFQNSYTLTKSDFKVKEKLISFKNLKEFLKIVNSFKHKMQKETK